MGCGKAIIGGTAYTLRSDRNLWALADVPMEGGKWQDLRGSWHSASAVCGQDDMVLCNNCFPKYRRASDLQEEVVARVRVTHVPDDLGCGEAVVGGKAFMLHEESGTWCLADQPSDGGDAWECNISPCEGYWHNSESKCGDEGIVICKRCLAVLPRTASSVGMRKV